MLDPQAAHHIVQAAFARTAGAQLQIKRERDQGALGVVADDGVGRVLVLAVLLRPRIE